MLKMFSFVERHLVNPPVLMIYLNMFHQEPSRKPLSFRQWYVEFVYVDDKIIRRIWVPPFVLIRDSF